MADTVRVSGLPQNNTSRSTQPDACAPHAGPRLILPALSPVERTRYVGDPSAGTRDVDKILSTVDRLPQQAQESLALRLASSSNYTMLHLKTLLARQVASPTKQRGVCVHCSGQRRRQKFAFLGMVEAHRFRHMRAELVSFHKGLQAIHDDGVLHDRVSLSSFIQLLERHPSLVAHQRASVPVLALPQARFKATLEKEAPRRKMKHTGTGQRYGPMQQMHFER